MNEAGMNRELTPEERIEQLEKEKAALELQIKNQAKYDEMRKAGDDLALAMKAIQDSGFSREEAMQIFMMGSMNTTDFKAGPRADKILEEYMNTTIPPFLRR